MPPRHVFWTIILEGKPTAFRAGTQEELLPTLRQLQAKHPDAVMKWFARGRLWQSPEEERDAQRRDRGERRDSGWRPGGAHRDPRERFRIPRDEKRRRFAEKQRRTGRPPGAPGEAGGRSPRREQPPRGFDQRGGGWKPRDERSGRPDQREGWKPHDRSRGRPPQRDRFTPDRPPGSRPPGRSFGRGPVGSHGHGGRPGPRPPRRNGGRKPGGGRRGGGGSGR